MTLTRSVLPARKVPRPPRTVSNTEIIGGVAGVVSVAFGLLLVVTIVGSVIVDTYNAPPSRLQPLLDSMQRDTETACVLSLEVRAVMEWRRDVRIVGDGCERPLRVEVAR